MMQLTFTVPVIKDESTTREFIGGLFVFALFAIANCWLWWKFGQWGSAVGLILLAFFILAYRIHQYERRMRKLEQKERFSVGTYECLVSPNE